MRAALRDANALRIKAAQAIASQDKAASTSNWNASNTINEQLDFDEFEVDDEEPVAIHKGRKKRLRHVGGDTRTIVRRRRKGRDWLGSKRPMRCGMPEGPKRKKRKRKKRKKRKKKEKILHCHNFLICIHTRHLFSLSEISEGIPPIGSLSPKTIPPDY
jgi:hypothetical protein